MTIPPEILSEIDEPCRKLVQAMNSLPGIETIDSCCGHGKTPMWIFFHAESLENLPPLLFWIDSCHSGIPGWSVIAQTDCAMSPVTFLLASGTKGEEAYREADRVAELISAWGSPNVEDNEDPRSLCSVFDNL